MRKPSEATRTNLTDFGVYVASCLPKYIQKVQLTAGDELELLICPEGVVPVLQFLKDHHSAQFASLVDIAGMDVPSRKYRFEVSAKKSFPNRINFIDECSGYFRLFTIYCRWDTIHGSV